MNKQNERDEIQSKTMLIDSVDNIDEILAQLNSHPDDEKTGVRRIKREKNYTMYIVATIITVILAAILAYFLR